jgi:hypothetical protein
MTCDFVLITHLPTPCDLFLTKVVGSDKETTLPKRVEFKVGVQPAQTPLCGGVWILEEQGGLVHVHVHVIKVCDSHENDEHHVHKGEGSTGQNENKTRSRARPALS